MKSSAHKETILWSKQYLEDLGDKDENGGYGYAYRYHIYWFTFPDKHKIKARRYTDTPDLCSLHGEPEDLDFKSSKSSKSKEYLSAIVHFLLLKEGVERIDYFNDGYKPVDLTKLKNNLKDFTFQRSND